ncbi:MAG TPA: hypothetical protein PLV16_08780 [Agitococcus sp.]|nr:hypothetical protein [Agitococcus sp.]
MLVVTQCAIAAAIQDLPAPVANSSKQGAFVLRMYCMAESTAFC